jgi:hypothetical protein
LLLNSAVLTLRCAVVCSDPCFPLLSASALILASQIVIFFIVAIICGFDFKSCKSR